MYLNAVVVVLLALGCGSVNNAKPDCATDANCDDGVFCNGAEVCTSAGACAAATAPMCDDGVSCTADACDEAAGQCMQTASDDMCGDRETCSADTGCVQPVTWCRLTSWRYGKPLQLTAAAATPDATFEVTLDTAALVSAGKLRADCNDLRLHRNLLPVPYWIESGCNTASTKLWVRATNLTAGANTIDVSYGNLAATTTPSDVESTFLLFEDFDNGIGAWTAGAERLDNFDIENSVSSSSVVSGTSGSSALLHGYAACATAPYDGVMPTLTRAFTNVTSGLCLDFQYRADMTDLDYPSSGEVRAIADINGTPVYNMGTGCAGLGCTAMGAWTAASATLGETTLTSLKLGALVGDCVKGDVYVDDVRLRTCVPSTDLAVTLGTETDCNTL